jgi:hypothetical protein
LGKLLPLLSASSLGLSDIRVSLLIYDITMFGGGPHICNICGKI